MTSYWVPHAHLPDRVAAGVLIAVRDGVINEVVTGANRAAADVGSGQLAPERAETWLAEVATADASLVATWRPFVHRFAALLPAR